MIISLIVAMGRNRVIGNNNALPWNFRELPADMKRFRLLTMGKSIIMGRKTFESIGKALPGRVNIIVTRDKNFNAHGCAIAHSPEEALKSAGDEKEVIVIGGASLFEQFLPLASCMYLTIIDHDFVGNTFFPAYDAKDWKEVERVEFAPDEKNIYRYTFLTLERR